MSAPQILREIFLGNPQFVQACGKEFFESHIEEQNPLITLVTCSDSRVQPSIFHDESINRIFVIRNIGNQIENNLGSVDYGVLHLKTPVLLILGHVNCGAIKTYLSGYEDEPQSVRSELDHLTIPLSKVDPSLPFEKKWLQGVELNLHWQVKIAMERYQKQVKEGSLTIVGAIYDFANTYGRGYGRIIIANINGQTKREELLNHPALKEIEPSFREEIVL
jgi:carbonic anhydrase